MNQINTKLERNLHKLLGPLKVSCVMEPEAGRKVLGTYVLRKGNIFQWRYIIQNGLR